ncbi:hypothetical protein NIES4071_74910 [Calothrix sp. NIES-4071]|nr:hypothetical protein NIES4071_74910 [Calothrix sp. NIES-4071]BAZ61766.1 hypothetical protein NIES4105_74860 [Calothrix sp. NIES-4105]
MIISDLNALEVVESAEVVGGFNQGYDFSYINFNEYVNIYKNVYSNTNVKGHLATAESDAKAYGYGTTTQIFTNTETTPFSSSSNGVSISASS